jgi:hypothetical protein
MKKNHLTLRHHQARDICPWRNPVLQSTVMQNLSSRGRAGRANDKTIGLGSVARTGRSTLDTRKRRVCPVLVGRCPINRHCELGEAIHLAAEREDALLRRKRSSQ